MRKYIFIILVIIFSSYLPVFSQQTFTSAKDTSNLISFETLAPHIEKQNQIKLYYKPEWFVGKRFRKDISSLPLNECLTIVKRLTELNCIAVNSSTYVFVPVEIRNYTNRIDNKGVVLIGDDNIISNAKNATISGKIIDMQSGKPLHGAKINIDILNITATSDKAGNYKLTLPIGEYFLRMNYADYKENIKPIRVNGNGIVDFELAESSILLKEVLVTDRAADLNVIRTQMSTIKFNSTTIKELPLFLGEKDVIKSVTLLPGVQSTGEFGTGFFVRGGSADQNLILVEDVPLFNSSHMFGLNSAINSDGISSASLLKAGIPAKFGERASSVMDIRLGSNPDKLSVNGGIGLINSRLNVELPLFNKKVRLLIGGRSSYSNWMLHSLPDADLKKSSASFYDMNALLSIRLNRKNGLTLFGYFSNDEFSFSQNSPYRYDNTLASIRYSHIFSDKLNSSLLLGLSRYRNEVNQSDTLKPNEAYRISSSTNYNNAKLNFTWSPTQKQSIDFGLNAILYKLQPGIMSPLGAQSDVISKITNSEKAIESAAYISDNINFSAKFSAELGVRFTRYGSLGASNVFVFKENAPRSPENITDTLHYGNNQIIKWYNSLEPRLSLRYSFDDVSSVKFSYNRISQFINLISNTAVMAPTDVYKLSSPNVSPLVCTQFTLGYFRNFHKNTYEASVEFYYKKLDNILEYRDGAQILLNNSLETDLLHASGYNYGAEFYLKKNTGRLTGWASYTYSRSMRHTTSPFEADQINRNRYYPSTFDKPHNVVINASYHITRRWRFAGTFNFNTGKPITLPELKYNYNGFQYVYYSDRNKYRLPDYHRLDIAITFDETLRLKQKWKGSWTFSILNLYAQKNPYSVFYKSTSQLESKFYQSFNLYQMFIIERPIPTFTYNFKF
ncbi:MAG: carboxypeptidase-like regulatory domain-containing protein [Bacteroidales bacterium]|nr:carboxypeptidase-like regulatory domain-containing protein [Bacteroidales bacterium]